MLDFLLTNQRKYDLTYWKLDGFCLIPPQESENGRWISGGYEDMYYVTEHWERWIDLFTKLYEDAEIRKSNLWLNLTSYVNPSPWMLQFCNSIYIQSKYDSWDLMVDNRDIKLEMQLNYRDDAYFDNLYVREWQFPVSGYFHHDPCFGKAAFNPNSATDEEFRMYLYMIAMRGAGLWDMLYSFENLDRGEKWEINTEVLNFAEENFDILTHSVLFGSSPKEGNCYGFSCWDPKTGEGIVAFRNPANTKRECIFDFSSANGVPENVYNSTMTPVMHYLSTGAIDNGSTYSYGDKLSLSLSPGEVRIYRFTKNINENTPEVVYVQANDITGHKIYVRFNQHIQIPSYADIILREGNNDVVKADSFYLHSDNFGIDIYVPEIPT